jgi:hypothetical protein
VSRLGAVLERMRRPLRRRIWFLAAPLVLLLVLLGGFTSCLAIMGSVWDGEAHYPPYDVVLAPQTALDGQGNVFALYQVSDGQGPTSYVQKLSPDGTRLWGEAGVRLDQREPDVPGSRDVYISSYPHMVVADDGGNVTVLWTCQGQIYAEKLDAGGTPVWQSGRVAVGAWLAPGQEGMTRWTVAANETGITVVWTRNSGDIEFQSLGSDGSLGWATPPIQSDAHEFEACRDENGNTWVVWADRTTGSIHLQVIDITGKTVWAEARELAHAVLTPTAQSIEFIRCALWLAEDGLGGMVVAWRHGDYGDGPLSVSVVSLDGKVQTSSAERFFRGYRATLPWPMLGGTQELLALWTTSDSILAQRIDSQGVEEWGQAGKVVATALAGAYTRFNASDDLTGATVLVWQSSAAFGPVWRAQRIDSRGDPMWAKDGVIISQASEQTWSWQWSAGSSDGAAILSGVMPEGLWREPRVCVQRIDPNGSLPWGVGGVRLDEWMSATEPTWPRLP